MTGTNDIAVWPMKAVSANHNENQLLKICLKALSKLMWPLWQLNSSQYNMSSMAND